MVAQVGAPPVLELSDRPDGVRAWMADLRRHGDVLIMLTSKDFKTRYKRATFGVLWAVLVPILQASIMAVVFSRVIKTGSGQHFAVYVMSGVIPYSYFTVVLNAGSTSIVDGAELTQKVWFPRLLLVVVPVLSNLFALVVTLAVLLAVMPVLGTPYRASLLLIVPATALLVVFTGSLVSVLAALHVYFRDVKFLVQAALMIWLYVTPILYPASLVGSLHTVFEANPLTGVVALFHMATVGGQTGVVLPIIVTAASSVVLFAVGAQVQRRHDRLFVDLL